MTRSAGQRRSLHQLAHRPYPPPKGLWLGGQSWDDLLFAHWVVDEGRIRELVPDELELDLWEGEAYVGLVPFRMRAIRLRPLPPLPGTTGFPELNVRTYVTHRGHPGVFFFSLDAANRFAVFAGRRGFHVPYQHARMRAAVADDGSVDYESERLDSPKPARFRASYRPVGEPAAHAPGTREYFLAERYCFYAKRPGGGLGRVEVHHPPWYMAPAEAHIIENSTTAPLGIELNGDPLLHFSRRQDVVGQRPHAVPGTR